MLFQVPLRCTPGKAPYAYWEDFLTDEDINYLLSSEVWEAASQAHVGLSSQHALNLDIRRTDVAWLNVNEKSIPIWNKFAEVLSRVNQEYFRFNMFGFYEPIQLCKYKAEDAGYYGWHIDYADDINTAPRKLSMALLLSDPSEFDGGELQLKVHDDEPISLEQKKGRVWIFPSYTLHRVTPVTRGERKSAVLWGAGPDFK